jgi:predicted  nucleic acid-binding Zn-ribbon protein
MTSQQMQGVSDLLTERYKDLEIKKTELGGIVADTEKEEKELMEQSKEAMKHVEERLLIAYSRVRGNARNGLAVVAIERDACGGCFNHIPPQRQMDIRLRKKITVCEHCGRILVDPEINLVEA